jgi:hypothetical protein
MISYPAPSSWIVSYIATLLGRRDRLEIVAGGANPAGVAIDFDTLTHLANHVIDRAEGKSLLVVNRAMENQCAAKIGYEPFSFHSRTPPLYGVEHFNADLVDQIRQEQPSSPVRVIHDVDSVRPSQVGHLDLIG